MENQPLIQLFIIFVLVFSAVIHEYMHGWMADRLGDPTAKNMGRLTLNPIPHLDPVGSIIVPLLLVLGGTSFVVGWAKPVPFNPYNLKDKIYGGAKVAIAGPLGNFITAIFFGLLIRFFGSQLIAFNPILIVLLSVIVQINLLLMIFNLVPIPPMDGSKVIDPFLPYAWRKKLAQIEPYGMFLVLAFVMFGFGIIVPVIEFLFKIIVGV